MKTSFDSSWEKEYYGKAKLQGGFPYEGAPRYPYDLVVSIVAKKFFQVPREKRSEIAMLDLGCGAGNNAMFLAENGFSVVGIDGSPSAIEICKERFREQGLQGEFREGDFLHLPYADGRFDFVLDRESLYANRRNDIKEATAEVYRVLKQGGLFLSFMYNTDHPRISRSGEEIEPNTYKDVKTGRFVGITHYADLKDVFDLFKDFSLENIMNFSLREIYNITETLMEGTEYIIVARKL